MRMTLSNSPFEGGRPIQRGDIFDIFGATSDLRASIKAQACEVEEAQQNEDGSWTLEVETNHAVIGAREVSG